MSMSKKNDFFVPSKKENDKDDQNTIGTLPGWPGYRTRNGRSGYDPIDARTEAAHLSGTLIQQLFTGQLRIENPIYLFILGVLGLVLISPLVFAILEMMKGNLLSWDSWIFLLITGLIGLAVLINSIKNLIRINK
jgi:hypothetical protein